MWRITEDAVLVLAVACMYSFTVTIQILRQGTKYKWVGTYWRVWLLQGSLLGRGEMVPERGEEKKE